MNLIDFLEWTEGFAVHNQEEWQLVKNYFLLRNYDLSDNVCLAVDSYLEYGVVFYAIPYYGQVQVITNIQMAKRDLVLKPIGRK